MIQVWLYNNEYVYIKSIMVDELTSNMTTVPLEHGYIKPTFNEIKQEWIEGANQEEIDAWYEANKPQKPQPTADEKVDGLIPIVQYHDEDIEFQGEISLDIDYRLTLVEMSLNINTINTLKLRNGDDEMAAKPNSTTYRNAKKQIERGDYEYEEMLTMLDTFLVGNRITQEEYQELKDLMDSQQK